MTSTNNDFQTTRLLPPMNLRGWISTRGISFGLGIAALLLSGTEVADAQFVGCTAPANCGTVSNMQVCTEKFGITYKKNLTMAVATGAATNCVTQRTSNGLSSMQPLSRWAIFFTASRPTNQPATGACNFAGTILSAASGGPFTWTCTIDAASGLPIELMDFEIVENSEDRKTTKEPTESE